MGVVYSSYNLHGTLRLHFDDGTTDRAEWFTLKEHVLSLWAGSATFCSTWPSMPDAGYLVSHNCRGGTAPCPLTGSL